MLARIVLLPLLAVALSSGGAGAMPSEQQGHNGARPNPQHERLAQGKQEDDDPSVPGGLPGRSGKSEEAPAERRRGYTPRSPAQPKTEASKEKGKVQDKSKKSAPQ
jgi:hypothetical protein